VVEEKTVPSTVDVAKATPDDPAKPVAEEEERVAPVEAATEQFAPVLTEEDGKTGQGTMRGQQVIEPSPGPSATSMEEAVVAESDRAKPVKVETKQIEVEPVVVDPEMEKMLSEVKAGEVVAPASQAKSLPPIGEVVMGEEQIEVSKSTEEDETAVDAAFATPKTVVSAETSTVTDSHSVEAQAKKQVEDLAKNIHRQNGLEQAVNSSDSVQPSQVEEKGALQEAKENATVEPAIQERIVVEDDIEIVETLDKDGSADLTLSKEKEALVADTDGEVTGEEEKEQAATRETVAVPDTGTASTEQQSSVLREEDHGGTAVEDTTTSTVKGAKVEEEVEEVPTVEVADLAQQAQEAAMQYEAAIGPATPQSANAKRLLLVERLLDEDRCVDCDLTGVDLSGKSLSKVDLERAKLQGANLEGVNLKKANLKGADLRGANLKGANLRKADLYRTDFTGADLTEADLEGALIDSADFSGATGVNLKGSITPE
jgi:uncharacterized protein YjbI with pentapeptide repeats